MELNCTDVKCAIVKSLKGYGIENVQCSQYVANDYTTTFRCNGNRAYEADLSTYSYLNDSSTQYMKFGDGEGESRNATLTLIKNKDINRLRDLLKTEINKRAKHVWYSGLNPNELGEDIQTGDVIDHPQQNNVRSTLQRLKALTNSNTDYKESSAVNVTSREAKTGYMVETSNLKTIEKDLYWLGDDCICYSDCTQFQLYKIYPCKCQGHYNCGCVY